MMSFFQGSQSDEEHKEHKDDEDTQDDHPFNQESQEIQPVADGTTVIVNSTLSTAGVTPSSAELIARSQDIHETTNPLPSDVEEQGHEEKKMPPNKENSRKSANSAKGTPASFQNSPETRIINPKPLETRQIFDNPSNNRSCQDHGAIRFTFQAATYTQAQAENIINFKIDEHFLQVKKPGLTTILANLNITPNVPIPWKPIWKARAFILQWIRDFERQYHRSSGRRVVEEAKEDRNSDDDDDSDAIAQRLSNLQNGNSSPPDHDEIAAAEKIFAKSRQLALQHAINQILDERV